MAFRVEPTKTAKQDLRNILAWLRSQEAGEAGLRWYEGMEKAMASLAEFPARCPIARESASMPFEMRQLLYGSKRYRFRILFTIEGETVFILRIRRGSQKDLRPH
jgi:plasmid stabilization system protein ParE